MTSNNANNRRRIKLLHVVPSLDGRGGAERFSVDLLNHLNPEEFDLAICETWGGTWRKQELKPHIKQLSPQSPAKPESHQPVSPVGCQRARQWARRLGIGHLYWAIRNHFDRRIENRLAALQSKMIAPVVLPADSAFFPYRDFGGQIAAFKKAVRSFRPDLVVSSMPEGGHMTCLAAIKAGLPKTFKWIAIEHNNLSASTRQNYTHPDQQQARYRLIQSYQALTDRIVTVSQGIGDDLVTHFGATHEKIISIHNPVDLERIKTLAQKPAAPPCPPPYILSIGRLHPVKNYPLLLRAFASIHTNIPHQLVIVGAEETGDQQRKILLATAQSLGIAHKVHFPGFTSNPYPILRQADLFVLSSNHEGFGIVLVEAMALGIPVLATDCDFGPREIITHGVNGWLTPVNDKDALAANILKITSDSALQTQITVHGRAHAQNFSVASIIQQYSRLFHDAVVLPSNSRKRSEGKRR